MWGKGARSGAIYVFVVLGVLAALLQSTTGTRAGGVALRPDLRTAPLPTSPSQFNVNTADGSVHFRFTNGLQNAGAGPFEVSPAGDPASDDCNNNGDPLDDA